METTRFIAQIFGPLFLTVAIGVAVNMNYYAKLVKSFSSEAYIMYFAGLMNLIGGIVLTLNHNMWDGLEMGVVSFLGWAMLVKGVMLVVAPQVSQSLVKAVWNEGLMVIGIAFAGLLGGYLTYVGYFLV